MPYTMSGKPMPAAEDAFAVGTPPKSVLLSFRTWMASIVVQIVSVILVVTAFAQGLREGLQESVTVDGAPFTTQEIDKVVQAFQLTTGVGAAISIALTLLFAVKMKAGRNWARVVLAIVAVAGALFSVAQNVGKGPLLVLAAVQAVVMLVAVVFSYRPDAKAYFAQNRRKG